MVVPHTLDGDECAILLDALRALKKELLQCPEDPAPHIRGHGPGRGGSFIRPGLQSAPQHFLGHLIEADPAITAYATHPRLVAMCEEYIGGEARIVESNCFINTGNELPEGQLEQDPFVPSWHRGADLPFASHSVGGLSYCNFVKALTNLTDLKDESDGGTVRIFDYICPATLLLFQTLASLAVRILPVCANVKLVCPYTMDVSSLL